MKSSRRWHERLGAVAVVASCAACSLTQYAVQHPARADSMACVERELTALGYTVRDRSADGRRVRAAREVTWVGNNGGTATAVFFDVRLRKTGDGNTLEVAVGSGQLHETYNPYVTPTYSGSYREPSSHDKAEAQALAAACGVEQVEAR